MDQQTARWLVRDKYGGRENTRLLARDSKRLNKGEPLAYIIGWVDFLGCRIDLSYRPLIPRPETEYWTEFAIKQIQLRHAPVRILDLFAGSGCIGIAALKHLPKVKVDFADIDPNALRQIRKNLRLNRIPPARARIRHSDIFTRLPAWRENSGVSSEGYHYILANPPYIATGDTQVGVSVRKHEPGRALWGGGDGLRYIRALLVKAKAHLAPHGEIYMEFGAGQKTGVLRLAKKLGYRAEAHKDQFDRWRYIRLVSS